MVDSIIRLYDKNERAFNTNGIGILNDALTCTVSEELDNSLTLTLDYPVGGRYASHIKSGNIITAYPNPFSAQAEPFVITTVTSPISGRLTVNARHIAIVDLESFIVYPMTDDPSNVGYSPQYASFDLYNANDIIGMLKYGCQKVIDGIGNSSTPGSSTAVDSVLTFDVSDINQEYSPIMKMRQKKKTHLYSLIKPANIWTNVANPSEKIEIDVTIPKKSVVFAVLMENEFEYAGDARIKLRKLAGQYTGNNYETFTSIFVTEYGGKNYYIDASVTNVYIRSNGLVMQTTNSDGKDIRGLFKIDFSSIDTLATYMGTRMDDDSRWKQTDDTFKDFAQSAQCDYKYTYDYVNKKSKVVLLSRRCGTNSGKFSIEYASNMKEMTEQLDWTSVYKYIMPYYGSGDDMIHLSNGKVKSYQEAFADYAEYPVSGDRILIPNSSAARNNILPVDLSDEFYDSMKDKREPDETELYVKAIEYIDDNSYKLTSPKISLEVSFVQLSKSSEYKKYKDFENVVLGDQITVIHPDLDVSVTARVYSLDYDVISQKYTKMTVGNCRQLDVIDTLLSSGKRGLNNEKVGLNLGTNSVIKSQNIYYLKHLRSTTRYSPTQTTPPEPQLDKFGVNEWIVNSTGSENEWLTTPCRIPEVVEKYQNDAILTESYDIIGEHVNGSEYNEDAAISYYTYGTSSTKNTVSSTWKSFVTNHDYQYCYRVANSGSTMRFFNAATVPSGGATYTLNDLIDEGLPTALVTAINSGLFKIGDRFHSGENWNLYSYWHAIQRKYINGAIRTEEIAIDDSLNRQSVEIQDIYYCKVSSDRLMMAAPLMTTANDEDEEDERPSAPTTWVTDASGESNTWTLRKPTDTNGTYYMCRQTLNVDGSLSGVVKNDNITAYEISDTQTAYIEWTTFETTPQAPSEWVQTELPTTGDHLTNTWYKSIMPLKYDGKRYYVEQTLFKNRTFKNGSVYLDAGSDGFTDVHNIYYKTTSTDTPALPPTWIDVTTVRINEWYAPTEKQTYVSGYYMWMAKQYKKSNGETECRDLDLVLLTVDDVQTIFFRSDTDSSPTAPTTWVTLNTESSENWTLYCMKPITDYPYVWYTSQKKYSDGTTSVGNYQKATLSDYVSRSQSIRYRGSSSTAPALPAAWVSESGDGEGKWTTYILSTAENRYTWEIEQQEHTKSDGNVYLSYSPSSPCQIQRVTNEQQSLFYVTKNTSTPSGPSTWIATGSTYVVNTWFDDYTSISSPGSGETWKDYKFWRCVQYRTLDSGGTISIKSSSPEEIFFTETNGLAYAETYVYCCYTAVSSHIIFRHS